MGDLVNEFIARDSLMMKESNYLTGPQKGKKKFIDASSPVGSVNFNEFS